MVRIAWNERRWMWSLIASIAVAAAAGGAQQRQTSERPYTTWREYAGSADSMQYSALDQIDRTNVRQLRQAWFYRVAGEPVRLPFNPLVVDDVMFVAGAKNVVVALDAATGAERWVSSAQATERGLAYWESADRSDRRLILTTNGGLREIDARTGKSIATFGVNGAVDMRTGDPRRLGGPNKTPPRIFESLIIVGSNTGEGYGSPPGDLRAFDVITGRLVWTFHTIPRPGEFGYDTWPPDAWKYAGGANTWGEVTVDAKNGIVFFPTGSPTHDLYGADRAGDNLFGNCLLALDARTGKRRWHFQTVHHDLWDYDLTAAPKLLTIRDPAGSGNTIDVVAQAGKTGFLYVFERLTGKPVWPIEERPVPVSEVPGEVSSRTQPIPTKPPPFARQVFRADDVNPFMSADEQEQLRKAVREAANEGVFTPSSHLRYHIQFPGAWGGANWGSTAADPASGMLFVRSLEMPSYRKMSVNAPAPAAAPFTGTEQQKEGMTTYVLICAACHGPGQAPMKSPARLGADGFRQLVRQGKEQMPAFPEAVLPAAKLAALEAYLIGLPLVDSEQGDEGLLRLPPNPNRYVGPATRYSGSFSAGWYTSNGLPAVGPPWTQLVAYDLNSGTIKWRVADGQAPGLAERDVPLTGTVRPRNGPVVTGGGLVFVANSQDRMLRAYDKDTGSVVWSHELEANPEGIPAVYQIGGRQMIAFAAGASWGSGTDPVWKNAFHRKPARIEAQGYYAFALPAPQAAAQQKPAFERAAGALERVTWRTRTLVGDDRLTNWNFAIRGDGHSFLETVVRADAAIVDFVEAASTQKVSAQLPKTLDHNLTPEEIASIRAQMGPVKLLTYRAESLGDSTSLQKTLAFAKAMGAETVVVPSSARSIASLDALAEQTGINVAVMADAARPTRLMKELEGKNKRLGIGIDTGVWAQEGIRAADGLALVKDRLLYLNLRDRSARGNVLLGQGTAGLTAFFQRLDALAIRPLSMTLDTTGVVKPSSDLSGLYAAIDAFEQVVQPAYGANFTAFSKTRPIRWDVVMPGKGETPNPEALRKSADDVRERIVAAIPRQPYAKPKKRRKLLVIESLHGMSHNTIPHTNVMIEQMGKITGAWEAEFNNDLDNLKYPKIKEYDGVFLNSTVGELLADPAVREGLARFVREGGGLGGVHGTPWTSRNWDEFADMIGAQSAPHRIEQGVMKVYDPASPLMKPFGGKDLNFREEYYRFEHEGRGRLRWDQVRVLLTVELDNPAIEPRPWTGYKRPDNVYPVAWIRSYGKGRVFYNSLGHMPETFMTPEIVGHFLAGLQFMLGDLDADATPNPRK
jgi:quinoprotein glucose dehydrogenase